MSGVALVTGASSGVGEEIAVALADAGHRVAVADLDAAAVESVVVQITEIGGDAAAIAVDVTRTGSVTAAVAKSEERLGPVGILVHCCPPCAADPAGRQALADALRVVRAVVPGMTDRGGGHVVVVAPTRAATSGPPAAHPDLAVLVDDLTRDLAAAGVTVDAVLVEPDRDRDAARAVVLLVSAAAGAGTGRTVRAGGEGTTS